MLNLLVQNQDQSTPRVSFIADTVLGLLKLVFALLEEACTGLTNPQHSKRKIYQNSNETF